MAFAKQSRTGLGTGMSADNEDGRELWGLEPALGIWGVLPW